MRIPLAIIVAAAFVGLTLTANASANGSCGAVTGNATNITTTSATLNGVLGGTEGGDASVCYVSSFEYGTTTMYGSSTDPVFPGSAMTVPVSATITGLTPNTTYHFRLTGSDGADNVGSDATFTTVALEPTEPPPTASVSVGITASPTAVSALTNITYTIVVRNGGPADSSGTVLTNGIPAGMTLVSALTTRGSCSGIATVTCVIGAIGNGGSATVTIVAALTSYGSITDTATVANDNQDAGATNTKATATIVATQPAAPPPAPPPARAPAPPPPEPVNILIDHSLGGISIGLTEREVEKLLGSPDATLTISTGRGKHGTSVRYRVHGALFLITYDGSGHVVSIESYSPFFQVAGGVGPGSDLTLAGSLHGFRADYCELGYWNGTAHTAPGHVVTVFTPDGGVVASVLITQLRYYTACASGSLELPPDTKDDTVLNKSLAGISISMTRAQVMALYGKPASTLKISLGAGTAGQWVQYRLHGAPLLVTYDASGRVVSIETYSPFFRTAAGLGPGSPLALVQKLRGFHPDYCELGWWNGTAHTPPNHIVTVFTPNGAVVASVLITQLRLYTACDAGSLETAPRT